VAMLQQMIEDRRSSGCADDDMLDVLLSGDEGTRAKLTDEQIIDLLITLIYSGYETVSTTTMMVVKYLSDNLKALEQIRVCVRCILVQIHNKKYPLKIPKFTDDLLDFADRAS
jgi:cytochrome P450